MIEVSKATQPPLFPAADHHKLRRRTTAALCVLLLFSAAFVSYSAFHYSAAKYPWGWPASPAAPPPPPAAAASPTNISHIVFGIAGSAATWQRRRGYSELWWRPGATRGHVWLDEAPHSDGGAPWPATCPPYRVSSPGAARYGRRADASRIARIAAEAYRATGGDKEEEVRWFVMGDDDTVFFPDNLVAVLGRYDYREMWYVGAPSESVEQDVMHSYGMAFGGGGFAVSYPAAAALAGAIDGCLERYKGLYGSDQRVHACFEELGVPLTREPGFHQGRGFARDAYGMLAAHPVSPVVSLHHLDYLKPITPSGATQLDALRTLMDAARADPARALQQAVCYLREPGSRGLSWSVSVAWGYTVQLYPYVLPPHDLVVPLQTFQTWRSWGAGPFTFNTRPLAGPDRPCERPQLYFMDRVLEGKRGPAATLTEYSRYIPEEEKGGRLPQCDRHGFDAAFRVDTVRVFAPRMNPDIWRRAPRRQCCEARRVGWLRSKTMEVRIRDCNPGEITSPP